MRRITCTFACGLLGLFFFITGSGLAWFGAKGLTRMWAWEKLTIKNSSEAMARWMRPPYPISMKVYIFNVTNPEAVSEGAYPIFTEVGPYVYEQHREKVNIIQLENYTLSYQLRNIITFKPTLSGRLKESDPVTILNVPLAVSKTLAMMGGWATWMKHRPGFQGAILTTYETVPEFAGMLDDIWRLFYPGQQNIFITTTVKEILFDGITIDCTSKITEVYVACRGMESRKSRALRKIGKNFKFSFFHHKNGTTPETYQINQGIYDLKKSAQYEGVNYSPSISNWKDPYCDMINGSDGAQFPLLVDKTQKLYIFEKEICRSVYVEFEEEINRNGVTLYKFSNTRSVFASPEENPDNRCFCRQPLRLRDLVNHEGSSELENDPAAHSICFEDGILSLMECVGAPIVASFPHFYLGDQSYINYSSLHPVKELHETFVYVEPKRPEALQSIKTFQVSGVAVNGFKRLQFNLEVKRIFDVQLTSNLIDGLFPILWVEEGMQLSPEHFKLLRYTLIEKKVLEYGTLVLIGFGIFLIITSYTARFITQKAKCCESTAEDFLAVNDLQTSKSAGYDDVTQPVRGRLGIWQNPKGSVTPGVSAKQKNAEKLQKTFLIDNFIQ